MYKTLVLNSDYNPISVFPLHVIPAQDAITRVFNGTCYVVSEYDAEIKTQNPKLHMNWPAIIVRKEYTHLTKHAWLAHNSLYYRDHSCCAYCGQPVELSSCTIDHVLPKSKGGTHTWDNVVLSCAKCNHSKSDSMPTGRWKPLWQPWEPTYWELLEKRKEFPITVNHPSWGMYLRDWKGEIKCQQMSLT